MGLISGIKAIKAAQVIKNGGTAEMSYAMLSNLLINLPDARKNLPGEKYRKIYALYKDFQQCNTMIPMDQISYIQCCQEIIGKFDVIAPYQFYSGGNELEFSMMMDDFRKEKQDRVDLIKSQIQITADNCEIDENYVKTFVDTYNQTVKPDDSITREEAIGFYRVLRENEFNGKEAALARLDKYFHQVIPYHLFEENSSDELWKNNYQAVARINGYVGFCCGAAESNGVISRKECDDLRAKYTYPWMACIDRTEKKSKTAKELYSLGLKQLKNHDTAEGIESIKKAAEYGYTKAQVHMGVEYIVGESVPKNYEMAAQWLLKAATEGSDAEAMVFLGSLYYEGKLEKDIEKAIYWLEKAAKLNNVKAMSFLGSLYYEVKPEKDIEKAIYWLEKAANLNNDDAQTNLGIMYLEGKLVPKDIIKGIHWTTKAAQLENVNAQINLVMIYLNEENVPFDGNTAKYWLDKAVANDSRLSERAKELYERIAQKQGDLLYN